MNEAEVNAQISQMVQFIHQEAREKAAEIKLKVRRRETPDRRRALALILGPAPARRVARDPPPRPASPRPPTPRLAPLSVLPQTDEEFNIEKLRMVEAEKQKIRADYERKEKQAAPPPARHPSY